MCIRGKLWKDKPCGDGASISQVLESNKSGGVQNRTFRSLPERHSGSESEWNPRWNSVVLRSPWSEKERKCRSVAEFPGTVAGRPVANSEPRSQLSAPCCQKP